MKRRRFQIVVALSLIGALALATGGPAASAPSGKVAPRSVKKATQLTRQSAARLTKDYAKGRAYNVCTGLTTKARKSLGGGVSCVLRVKRVAKLKPISKISIKTIVFRRNHARVDVSGYINGNPKKRLAVAFKREGGSYRLDHALVTLKGLFAR